MAIGAFDYSPREIVLGRGLTATSCVGQVTHGEPALDSSSFAMFAAIRRASARPSAAQFHVDKGGYAAARSLSSLLD